MTRSPAVGQELPIVADFDSDVIGEPPPTGGPGQPIALDVPPGASITVAGSANGIDSPCLLVDEGDAPGQPVRAIYLFPPQLTGPLRVEATIAVDGLPEDALEDILRTSQGPISITQLDLQADGTIHAWNTDIGGPVVGTWTPGEPFRVRADLDLDARTWSVTIDDDLDGFEDDPVFGGLTFSTGNPPPLVPVTQLDLGMRHTGNPTDPVTIAYDDIEVLIPKLGCNVEIAGATTFADGDEYVGTRDTYLFQGTPDVAYGDELTVRVDAAPLPTQGLLRFEGIFGSGATQVPARAAIQCARLVLQISEPGLPATEVHRMLQPWSEDDTWSSWGNGIQANGVEAAVALDTWVGTAVGTIELDVTTSVQTWADCSPNHGWVFIPVGPSGDGWEFAASEQTVSDLRPSLEVAFLVSHIADVDNDGVVNQLDLIAVIEAWGTCDPGSGCPADTDCDGVVGVRDLIAVLSGWMPE